MAYSYQSKSKDEKLAFARRENINASFKDLANVCANIRYKNPLWAIKFLENAAKGLVPVRYFKHNKKRGHLRALGGKKGGYPKKAASIVLDVLKNAVLNSNREGLGNCKIIHAVANKQQIYRRLAPKGRRIRHDLETAFVEIVLKEIKSPVKEEKQKTEIKQQQTKQDQEQKVQPKDQKDHESTKKEKTLSKQEKGQKQESKTQESKTDEILNQTQPHQTQEKKEQQTSERKKFSEVVKKKPK